MYDSVTSRIPEIWGASTLELQPSGTGDYGHVRGSYSSASCSLRKQCGQRGSDLPSETRPFDFTKDLLDPCRVLNRNMNMVVNAPLEPPTEESLGTSAGAEEGEHVLHNDSRPYSCFSQRQKTCISYIASFSAMFSGLSSFIYYPSITAISSSLDVSVELINLTITSYQIVSGIAPSILGDLADQSGRRPVCLIAFILYFSANLGLALQNSYTALVALRCLQSAGASSMFPRSLILNG